MLTRTLRANSLTYNYGVRVCECVEVQYEQTVWAPTAMGPCARVLSKAAIIRTRQVEHIKAEKTILDKVDHPFIVRLCGFSQDGQCLNLVLEYVVGGAGAARRPPPPASRPLHCAYEFRVVACGRSLHPAEHVFTLVFQFI